MRKAMAVAAVICASALAAPAAFAQGSPATDYAQTALNIIPSGQSEPFEPLPPTALPQDTQAQMYNALTPLGGNVTDADLSADFKSEAFDPTGAMECPCTPDPVPMAGVTITRDKYFVPHVFATTHDGGVWAAGWIAAEDRGLLLKQARYDSLLAAIDAPGLSALHLVEGLDTFEPTPQTERVVSEQTQALEKAGPEGRDVLHDIDTYISGINAYSADHGDSLGAPFTRNDIYAFNALKDQVFGEGGGNQAQNSEFLAGLEKRLGTAKGYSVFDDLRQNTNSGSPTTVDGTFNYDHTPKAPGAPGSVLLKPGSFKAITYQAPKATTASLAPPAERPHASNELMVEAKYSATGHPLLVGGPQIGYFNPGLTYEIDMHAGDLNWRGATSAPFPGYLLIGRGPDFATTLTSAGAADTDEFAEQLCGGSQHRYSYRGKCIAMKPFDAGTVTAGTVKFEVKFWTTVNGPVIGYATTTDGTKVAITSKRASYGKDVLDLLFNRRLSDGQVDSPQSFIKAAAMTPQTFNSFYIDDSHIAEITTGLLPLRAKHTDPSLPTVGNGKYEWRGFLSTKGHPQGIDPQHTPVKGTMVNWNNIAAHGFGAAPDNFGGDGSAARVSVLNDALAQHRVNGKWTLAGVAGAMNEAATQNVLAVETVPLLARVLKGSKAPSRQAAQMLQVLVSWSKDGGSMLPDPSNPAKIANPGAAVINGAWTKLANAFMRPVLGNQLNQLNSLFPRFDGLLAGQYDGWFQYFDRDIKKLLHIRQPQPFRNSYCGDGNLKACQKALWGALESAGKALSKKFGNPHPAAWRANSNAIALTFAPVNLLTMQYTNRPSGIQQVISFDAHR